MIEPKSERLISIVIDNCRERENKNYRNIVNGVGNCSISLDLGQRIFLNIQLRRVYERRELKKE